MIYLCVHCCYVFLSPSQCISGLSASTAVVFSFLSSFPDLTPKQPYTQLLAILKPLPFQTLFHAVSFPSSHSCTFHFLLQDSFTISTTGLAARWSLKTMRSYGPFLSFKNWDISQTDWKESRQGKTKQASKQNEKIPAPPTLSWMLCAQLRGRSEQRHPTLPRRSCWGMEFFTENEFIIFLWTLTCYCRCFPLQKILIKVFETISEFCRYIFNKNSLLHQDLWWIVEISGFLF